MIDIVGALLNYTLMKRTYQCLEMLLRTHFLLAGYVVWLIRLVLLVLLSNFNLLCVGVSLLEVVISTTTCMFSIFGPHQPGLRKHTSLGICLPLPITPQNKTKQQVLVQSIISSLCHDCLFLHLDAVCNDEDDGMQTTCNFEPTLIDKDNGRMTMFGWARWDV